MSADFTDAGIWLLYDGECPMCSAVATAVRLKREFGALHLLDARTSKDHPLYMEVSRRGLDLDEGMVVVARGEFFHGDEAVQLIARTSDGSNLTSFAARTLFRSGRLTRLCYPALRALRNRFLKHKKVQQIDNLGLRERPLFETILGSDWEDLPPALKRHYQNLPYSRDQTYVEGEMDIACFGPLRLLAPLMNLMDLMPAHTGSNIFVTVAFTSSPDCAEFTLNRAFYFSPKAPHYFTSRMRQIKGNQLVERMAFGLCWKFQFL